MITANLSIFGSSYGVTRPLQPEYEAILSKALALGYAIPDTEQQRLDNNVIFYLKQVGIWNELDLLYMFKRGVSQANFARLNWKNPNAFQLTSPSPNVFVDNVGFIGGIGTYMNTNYTPTVNGVKALVNNTSYFYKATGSANPLSVYGTRNGSANNLWKTATTSYLNTSTAVGGLNVPNVHGSILEIKSGVNQKSYFNGALAASGSYTSSTLSSFPLVLFALNNGGAIQNITTAENFRLEYFGNGSAVLEAKQLELYKILNHIFD